MDFPATLPCFQFAGYAVAPRQPVLEVDHGLAVRRRQIVSSMFEQINVQMTVSGSQESELRNFYNITTEMGSAEFDASILIAGSYQLRRVKFINAPPVYVPVADGFARVTATLLMLGVPE